MHRLNSPSAESSRHTLYVSAWAALLLLATPYIQPNYGGAGLSLPFNSTTWIAVTCLILISIAQINASGNLKYARSDLVLLVCVLLLGTPLAWSKSPWLTESLGRYLAITAAFLLVLGWRQWQASIFHERILLILLTVAGLTQSGISLAQYVGVDITGSVEGGRPEGTFQQPNVAATFIASTLIAARYLLEERFSPKFWLTLMTHASLIAGCCSLLLIVSRTGLLGFAIATVFSTLLLGIRKSFPALMSLLIGALLAAALSAQNPQGFDREIKDPGYRTTLYTVSFDLFKARPLGGWGLGSFQSVYLEQQSKLLETSSELEATNVALSHPHNELLFWGVEGGIVPVLALVFIALYVTWLTWSQGTSTHKIYWVCALPIVLHTQTELPLYLSTPHLALLALFVAASNPQETKTRRLNKSKIMVPISLTVALLTIVFMVTNLHTTKMLHEAPGDFTKLNNIINPFAQEQRLNEILAEILSQSPDSSALRQAEEIARSELTVRPTVLMYQILIDSLNAQNRPDEATETLTAATKAFPRYEGFEDKTKRFGQ